MVGARLMSSLLPENRNILVHSIEPCQKTKQLTPQARLSLEELIHTATERLLMLSLDVTVSLNTTYASCSSVSLCGALYCLPWGDVWLRLLGNIVQRAAEWRISVLFLRSCPGLLSA